MSKLISSTAKNIKAITDASFNFEGKTAIIVGANDRGKSTIIDCFRTFVKGKDGAELLHNGADEGTFEQVLDTGEKLTIEVKKGKKAKAFFTTPDGKKEPFTKKLEEKFFPNHLDLNAFAKETPAKQRKMLLSSLNIDTTAFDTQESKLTDERKDIGREKKRIEGYIKTIPAYDPELPETETSAADVLEWIESANKRNSTIQTGVDRVAGFVTTRTENFEKITELQNQIDQLDIANIELAAKIETGNAWIAANELIPAAEIAAKKESLTTIEAANKAIRDNLETKRQAALLEAEAAKYKTHTEAIEAVRAARLTVMSGANLPDNIQITDTGILIDGLPLVPNQHSHSKIGISELKIAYATIGAAEWLTFDASGLDRSNMEAILEWSREVGVQLLIEEPNKGREESDDLHFELIEE